MFLFDGYPLWFFKKCFKKFNKKFLYSHFACRDHIYNLNVSYFGHDSRWLINKLQNIMNSKLKLALKINPVYKTFKVSQYFQLKTRVPPALCSNTVQGVHKVSLQFKKIITK